MPESPYPDQRLPLHEDIPYTEPPKSVALYLDATKWIVGLATGAFFLLGSVLGEKAELGIGLKMTSVLAIVCMSLAAALGVWALQGYTKLANLVEINAGRSGVEVETRNNGYEEIRWVTTGRLNRIRDIKQWTARANFGYTWMTYLFMCGLGLLLIYGGLYAFRSQTDSPVQFIATSSRNLDVLGVVQDKASATSCVVMRSKSGLQCARPASQ